MTSTEENARIVATVYEGTRIFEWREEAHCHGVSGLEEEGGDFATEIARNADEGAISFLLSPHHLLSHRPFGDMVSQAIASQFRTNHQNNSPSLLVCVFLCVGGRCRSHSNSTGCQALQSHQSLQGVTSRHCASNLIYFLKLFLSFVLVVFYFLKTFLHRKQGFPLVQNCVF